jgi:hypothetical protein
LYFGLLDCSVVELDPADKRTVIRNATTGEYVTPIFRSTLARHARALTSGRRHQTAFTNAPSIREIAGHFWLSYWAVGGGRFFGMYHAVADDPLGPFQPVGPLVSLGNAWKNTPPGPTDRVGNTHGGMFESHGTWYQIYHRQTADGRQACATPLTRAPHGGFAHAEYTSLGFDPSALDAFRLWPACIACHLVGPRGPRRRSRRPSIVLREDPRGTADESGRRTLQVVSHTYPGSTTGFKYLDFGAARGSHTTLAELDARSSGRIQVYLVLRGPNRDQGAACGARRRLDALMSAGTSQNLPEMVEQAAAVYRYCACRARWRQLVIAETGNRLETTMRPMFKELFIQTEADDLLAEQHRRHRVSRARRARPATVIMLAAGNRQHQPRP